MIGELKVDPDYQRPLDATTFADHQPTRFAVSGPIGLNAEAKRFVRDTVVREVPSDAREFTSGTAYGVDSEAFEALAAVRPWMTFRLTVPAAWHNERLISLARLLPNCHVERVRAGHGVAHSYMLRNDATIEHCDVLIAFPATAREVRRGSGTWATIRRARKARKRVWVFPLDGSEPWKE